jgi:hypothetical protein
VLASLPRAPDDPKRVLQYDTIHRPCSLDVYYSRQYKYSAKDAEKAPFRAALSPVTAALEVLSTGVTFILRCEVAVFIEYEYPYGNGKARG